MGTTGKQRIVEIGASACLAAACAFGVYSLLDPELGLVVAGATGALAAVITYHIAVQILVACDRRPVLASLKVTDTSPNRPHVDDGRVVQLFERPAQLGAPTDIHQRRDLRVEDVQPVDASDALRQALEQLRQSLRHG